MKTWHHQKEEEEEDQENLHLNEHLKLKIEDHHHHSVKKHYTFHLIIGNIDNHIVKHEKIIIFLLLFVMFDTNKIFN